MRCVIPHADLNQRLNDTVCRYEGLAVRIKYHGGDLLDLCSVGSGHLIKTIKSNDPGLDISGIPLGYVQITPGIVVYTSRRPLRIYKQGVSNDVIATRFTTTGYPGVKFSIFSKPFEDMVNNRYPNLDAALKLLRKKYNENDRYTEIAISRDIALKYNHEMQITHVFFRGDEVGFIIKDTRTVITPSTDKGWIISKHLGQFDWEVE